MYELTAGSDRRCPGCTIPTVRLSDISAMKSLMAYNFFRYKGFASTQVAPNASGTKTGYAFFDSPELASVAKEALDGFTLKKGWKMGVSYT